MNVARSLVGQILAGHDDLPRLRRDQAGERFDQFGLPIALHARNPQNFTLAHIERDTAHRFQPALVMDNEIFNLEDIFLRFCRSFFHSKDHFAPDHHGRQLMLAGLRRRGRAHHLPAAHHGDAVGNCQHFLELVGDEDDRNAPLGQLAHDAEQVFRFLRSQHGGRFVQDQDVGLR